MRITHPLASITEFAHASFVSTGKLWFVMVLIKVIGPNVASCLEFGGQRIPVKPGTHGHRDAGGFDPVPGAPAPNQHTTPEVR